MNVRTTLLVHQVIAAVLTMLFVACPALGQTRYAATRIPGPTPSEWMRAAGMNAAGVIVGYPTFWDAPDSDFIFEGGKLVSLGSFVPIHINDRGDIIGQDRDNNARYLLRADGSSIGGIAPVGSTETVYFAINAVGDLAGAYQDDSTVPFRAFAVIGGTFVDVGMLEPYCRYPATRSAINRSGEIVGSSGVGTESVHAFHWSSGVMRDLGTLGVSWSHASDINAGGDIVGDSTLKGEATTRAILYSKGSMRDLGTPSGEYSTATAINDAGQIAKLDNGAFEGWARTGQRFVVAPEHGSGASAVCRFFSTSFGDKSSHFYTASSDECLYVRRNLAHDWAYEGNVFWVATPDAAGACPTGTAPVYRVYDNGQGGAPNHRYTTSIEIRAQMLTAGWIPEGSGALGVAMCAVS